MIKSVRAYQRRPMVTTDMQDGRRGKSRHRKSARAAAVQATYPTFQLDRPRGAVVSAAPASRYARYVGRVGALAVALGVGTAVATGQGFGLGMARADETGSTDGPSNEAPADPGPAAADESANMKATPPSIEPPNPVADDEGEGEAAEANPYVPEMNYAGGVDTDDDAGSVDTQEDADAVEPTEEETPPAPPSEETPGGPQYQAPLKDAEAQDNSSPVVPPPPNTDAVQEVVEDKDPATTRDFDAPAQARMAVMLDDDVDAVGQTMLLSSLPAGQDSALSTADAEVTQAEPVDALMGIPGAVVSVATSLVGLFLSPFLAPGPVAPAQPPLLFALLGWVQREIQRAFFNRTPEAVDDTVLATEDIPKVIDVLGNDTDVDDDPISITSFTQPTHGTVVQNPDGTFTYTPAANYHGPDSFTYTVRDQGFNLIHDVVRLLTGQGPRTDTATVNLTVAPVNDAPVAVDDTNTATEDAPASGNVLSNDTDIDTPASGLSAALGTQAAKGTAVVNGDGSYTYTPNANYTGTDTFTYTVSDGTSTDTGQVTITIAAVNDAPVVTTTAGSTAYAEEAPAVVVDSGLTVTDADSAQLTGATVIIGGFDVGDSLVFTAPPGSGLLGTIDPATGTLTVTGTASVAQYQEALRSVQFASTADTPTATKTITFTVTDGTNTSAAVAKTVTITLADGGVVSVPVVGVPLAPLVFNADGSRAVLLTAGEDASGMARTGVTVIDTATGGAVDAPVVIDGEFSRFLRPAGADLPVAYVVTEVVDPAGVAPTTSRLAIIDVATGAVRGGGPVTFPGGGVSLATFNEDASRLYVVSRGEDRLHVTVFDTTNASVIGTPVEVIADPDVTNMGFNEDFSRAYLFVVSTDPAAPTIPVATTIVVIDTTTSTRIGEVLTLPGGPDPLSGVFGLRPAGDGIHVWTITTDGSQTTLTTITLADGGVVSVPVVGVPLAPLVFNADGSRAVLLTAGEDASGMARTGVTVIDTATGGAVDAPVVIDGEFSRFLRPAGADLPVAYVVTEVVDPAGVAPTTSRLAIIDVATGAVRGGGPVTFPGGGVSLATFNEDASRLYVVSRGEDRLHVTVFDTTNASVIGTPVEVIADPDVTNMGFNEDFSRAYLFVVSTDPAAPTIPVATTIVVIDTTTSTRIGEVLTLPGGPDPLSGVFGLRPAGDGIHVWTITTDGSQTTLTTITLADGGVVSVPVVGVPLAPLVFNADGSRAVLLTAGEDASGMARTGVTVIDTATGGAVDAPVVIDGEFSRFLRPAGADLPVAYVVTEVVDPAGVAPTTSRLAIIDVATGAVRGGGPVTFPGGGVSLATFNEDASRLYVVSRGEDRLHVTVFDTTNASVIGTPVEVIADPDVTNMGFNEDFSRAYLFVVSTDPAAPTIPVATTIVVIDTTTSTRIGEVLTLPGGPDPLSGVFGLRPAGDGIHVWTITTDGSQTTLTTITLADGGVVSVPVVGVPLAPLVFNADGSRAVLLTAGEDASGMARTGVTVIDTATGGAVDAPVVIDGEFSRFLRPAGADLPVAYVVTEVVDPAGVAPTTSRLAIIDVATGAVRGGGPVTFPGGGVSLATFNEDASRLYVVSRGEDRLHVTVFDTTNASVIGTPVEVIADPDVTNMGFNEDFSRAYLFVVSTDPAAPTIPVATTIVVIDTTTSTRIGEVLTLPGGPDPLSGVFGLRPAGDGIHVWTITTDGSQTTLTTITLADGGVVSVPVVGVPLAPLVFNADGSRAVLLTAGEDASGMARTGVTVIDTATGGAVDAPVVIDGEFSRFLRPAGADLPVAYVVTEVVDPAGVAPTTSRLAIIDVATGAVRGGGPVTFPGGGVSLATFNEDASRLYVVSRGEDRLHVTVFDTTNASVIGTPVEVIADPDVTNMGFNEDFSRAYLFVVSTDPAAPTIPVATTIVVIDTTTSTRIGEVLTLPGGPDPLSGVFGLRPAGDGIHVWTITTDGSQTTLTTITLADGGVVSVPVVGVPLAPLVFNADGSRAVLLTAGEDASGMARTGVTVIDTATGGAVDAPVVIDGEFSRFLRPAGADLPVAYVVTEVVDPAGVAPTTSRLAIIDVATGAVRGGGPVTFPGGGVSLATFNEDASRLYVVSRGEDRLHVTVFDTTNASVIGTPVEVIADPDVTNMGFNEDFSRAYLFVVSTDPAAPTIPVATTIVVIDTTTSTRIGEVLTLPGGPDPLSGVFGLRPAGDGIHVWTITTDGSQTTLTTITLADGGVVSVPVVGVPLAPLVFNADGSRAVLLTAGEDASGMARTGVTVIDTATGGAVDAPVVIDGEFSRFLRPAGADLPVAYVVTEVVDPAGVAPTTSRLAIIDVATGAVRGGGPVTFPGGGVSLATFNEDASRLYVVSRGEDRLHVTVFDTTNASVIGTPVEVIADPDVTNMGFNEDFSRAYLFVVSTDPAAPTIPVATTIVVIDTTTSTRIGEVLTLPGGPDPLSGVFGLRPAGDGIHVWTITTDGSQTTLTTITLADGPDGEPHTRLVQSF